MRTQVVKMSLWEEVNQQTLNRLRVSWTPQVESLEESTLFNFCKSNSTLKTNIYRLVTCIYIYIVFKKYFNVKAWCVIEHVFASMNWQPNNVTFIFKHIYFLYLPYREKANLAMTVVNEKEEIVAHAAFFRLSRWRFGGSGPVGMLPAQTLHLQPMHSLCHLFNHAL